MHLEYPLYDELKAKVISRKDKTIDVGLICNTINNIARKSSNVDDMQHYQEIQALTIHHDVVSNYNSMLSCVPYDGKTMFAGKGVLYTFSNLPPLLQQIIAQYIEDCAK